MVIGIFGILAYSARFQSPCFPSYARMISTNFANIHLKTIFKGNNNMIAQCTRRVCHQLLVPMITSKSLFMYLISYLFKPLFPTIVLEVIRFKWCMWSVGSFLSHSKNFINGRHSCNYKYHCHYYCFLF